MEPARWQADHDVALANAIGSEDVRLVDDPDTEPGEIEPVVGHDPGVLSRLTPQEGTPGEATSFDDPLDDGGNVFGDDATDGEVVQEEQRLRSRAHDVVGAHRHEVDPHGVEPTGDPRDLELRADTVGGGRE